MRYADAKNIRGEFTMVPNQAIHTMVKKSQENAFALYCFMGSKPDNFIFRISWLAKEMHWSTSKVIRALGVLERAGYVKRERRRDSDGKFARKEYLIYFKPIEQKEDVSTYRSLTYPEELASYCELRFKVELINYAIQVISDADYQFLIKLNELSEMAYVQLMKEAEEVLEHKHPDNEEGYAIKVLGNKIKEYRHQYSGLKIGGQSDDSTKV